MIARKDQAAYQAPPVSFPSGPRWYVVRTNIRCEFRAEMGLAASGFRVFLPFITKWKKHAHVSRAGREPLFSRYLFVEADFNLQSLYDLYTTDGVESIVNNNGVPSSIYGDFIIEMLERQLKGEFNLIDKEPLPRGAEIEIMDGEFEGKIAIIERLPSKQRVEVLINIMGKRQRERLQLAQIRPAW